MKPVMKAISESTALSLSVVILLLGGVWSFAWSASETQKSAEQSALSIERVSHQLIETTAQIRVEIQTESNKRILRHEMEAWASELRLSNPGMNVPAVPRFQ